MNVSMAIFGLNQAAGQDHPIGAWKKLEEETTSQCRPHIISLTNGETRDHPRRCAWSLTQGYNSNPLHRGFRAFFPYLPRRKKQKRIASGSTRGTGGCLPGFSGHLGAWMKCRSSTLFERAHALRSSRDRRPQSRSRPPRQRRGVKQPDRALDEPAGGAGLDYRCRLDIFFIKPVFSKRKQALHQNGWATPVPIVANAGVGDVEESSLLRTAAIRKVDPETPCQVRS